MSVEPTATGTIEALLTEERRFPPPPALAEHANAQPGIYAEADSRLRSVLGGARAPAFEWSKPFTQVPGLAGAVRALVCRRRTERERQLSRSPRARGTR